MARACRQQQFPKRKYLQEEHYVSQRWLVIQEVSQLHCEHGAMIYRQDAGQRCPLAAIEDPWDQTYLQVQMLQRDHPNWAYWAGPVEAKRAQLIEVLLNALDKDRLEGQIEGQFWAKTLV